MKRIVTSGILCALLPVAACDSAADEPEQVTEWAGSEPHLRVLGRLVGEELDIDLQGGGAGMSDLFCEREYLAPMNPDGTPDRSMATMIELKLGGFAMQDGEARSFELEFKKEDFQSAGAGTSFRVVPRDETMDPGPGDIWFEWENYLADGTELFEEAATSGTLELELLSGMPEAGTTVVPGGEGSIGGFLSAKYSQDEELAMSFTAPCVEVSVEAE